MGFQETLYHLVFPLIPGRIFYKEPKRGDIVVFKTPEDNRTDYIKRLIGLPGDKISMQSNQIFINGKKIQSEFINNENYKSFDVKKLRKHYPIKNLIQFMSLRKHFQFIIRIILTKLLFLRIVFLL